jgi:hypothetical protein
MKVSPFVRPGTTQAQSVRIGLEENEFSHLVRGDLLVIPPGHGLPFQLEIKLSEVSWERMYFQIERAMRDAGVGMD